MTITAETPMTVPAGPSPIIRDLVAVIVPAYNEEQQIAETIESLLNQSMRPSIIVVMCDNCTDRTEVIAQTYWMSGVIVLKTINNRFKKAGALNQGIAYLLEQGWFPEFTVTIDADTILDDHYVEYSVRILRANPKLGGLSAVCRGKSGLVTWPHWDTTKPSEMDDNHKWLNPVRKTATYANELTKASMAQVLVWLQQAEYSRAGATRLRNNVHTLSGAGSIIRAEALLAVLNDRGQAYVERVDNLVEDYELTLEIKRHGWECTNNFHCIAYTDLMMTLPALLKQRIRWVEGSIRELRRRGWKSETRMSILAMLYGYLGMPLFYWWLWEFVRALGAHGLHWQTACVMTVVCGYQAWTLRSMGWVSKLIGFMLVPEQIFNLVRHTWLLSSLVRSFVSKKHTWE